uniref:Uncharacterized protein n=1 Tax=Anguilla anguilla TaxID=7936 RepID=A0A0E9RUZ0_ANGAN
MVFLCECKVIVLFIFWIIPGHKISQINLIGKSCNRCIFISANQW